MVRPLTNPTNLTNKTTNRPSLAAQLAAEFAPLLTRAQTAGGLGPGDIDSHIAHSLAYLDAYPGLVDAERVLDLGSGAGIPGLVLARQLPNAAFALLEGRRERASALVRSVGELGLSGRVWVISGRAEVAAHDPGLRFGFDAVVARAFSRPAVTAECGAGFLVKGGAFVVSEPPEPETDARWPAVGLEKLGLELESLVAAPFRFAVLRSVAPLDARYPRHVGIPAKRPLF
jgi:16S rRNA (guanine527-N7)-methyltransferase